MSKEGVEYTPSQIKNKLETTGMMSRITADTSKPKIGTTKPPPTRI
jgi:hypothetical protein